MLYGILSFENPDALKWPRFLFCGSFNPLHEGHVAIVDYLYNRFGVPVDFEISVNNVEKDTISLEEVYKRHIQMEKKFRPSFGKLYITDDARYLEKAEIFPDTTFVCGFDTIKALVNGGYYKDMDFKDVIKQFDYLGTKWIAFPRQKEDGTISTKEDFKDFPPDLLKNITIVDDFDAVNVRSRELRK